MMSYAFLPHLPKRFGLTVVETGLACLLLLIAWWNLNQTFFNESRSTQQVNLRANALLFSQDLADRIKANPTADYSVSNSSIIPTQTIANCFSILANCSHTQLKESDLTHWWYGKNGVKNHLPNAQIQIIDVGDDLHQIRLSWAAKLTADLELDSQQSELVFSFLL